MISLAVYMRVFFALDSWLSNAVRYGLVFFKCNLGDAQASFKFVVRCNAVSLHREL